MSQNNNSIKVHILSYNCLQNNQKNAITVSGTKLVLQELKSGNENQVWELIPNLVNERGVKAGGFTLFNSISNKAAQAPKANEQIKLGSLPVQKTYGEATYCWTLFPAGDVLAERLWAIQSFQRGNAMDAERGSCDTNTKILFWKWNDSDNQKWVIRRVD